MTLSKPQAFWVLLFHACSALFVNGPSQLGNVNPSVGVSSDCDAKASSGNCSFYDCFEQRFRCGSHGYALAYGGKYCRRLEGARDVFTDAGGAFIDKMALCQTKHLLTYYHQDSLNCNDFYSEAFTKMGECYLESGYCDVVVNNRDFDGFMHTFDRNDFLNLKLVDQVLGAAEKCGGGVETKVVKEAIASGLSG